MPNSSTALSRHERKGLRGRKAAKAPSPNSLLFTRKQTAELLNCSVATVIRLENAGRLDPV